MFGKRDQQDDSEIDKRWDRYILGRPKGLYYLWLAYKSHGRSVNAVKLYVRVFGINDKNSKDLKKSVKPIWLIASIPLLGPTIKTLPFGLSSVTKNT